MFHVKHRSRSSWSRTSPGGAATPRRRRRRRAALPRCVTLPHYSRLEWRCARPTRPSTWLAAHSASPRAVRSPLSGRLPRAGRNRHRAPARAGPTPTADRHQRVPVTDRRGSAPHCIPIWPVRPDLGNAPQDPRHGFASKRQVAHVSHLLPLCAREARSNVGRACPSPVTAAMLGVAGQQRPHSARGPGPAPAQRRPRSGSEAAAALGVRTSNGRTALGGRVQHPPGSARGQAQQRSSSAHGPRPAPIPAAPAVRPARHLPIRAREPEPACRSSARTLPLPLSGHVCHVLQHTPRTVDVPSTRCRWFHVKHRRSGQVDRQPRASPAGHQGPRRGGRPAGQVDDPVQAGS